MCLSRLCPQLFYMNPLGRIALSMYVCDSAAQDRAAQMIAAILLVMMAMYRLVAQISYGLPPHLLVPLVILGCARGEGHATGFHQPLPKETPYLCACWVFLVGVGVRR